MFPQWIVSVIAFHCPAIPPGVVLPNPTKDQLQLVEQLGSPIFNEREEAQKKLEKMDSEAYKALFAGATKNADPEIRHRCSQILPKVMRYNVPKDSKNLPTLFGTYRLKLKMKSGREFSIDKETFLKYYWIAIKESTDSWRNDRGSIRYMTYLLPKASHHLFMDMRLMGYSREDIDELMEAMRKNLTKMTDNRSYDYYQWVN